MSGDDRIGERIREVAEVVADLSRKVRNLGIKGVQTVKPVNTETNDEGGHNCADTGGQNLTMAHPLDHRLQADHGDFEALQTFFDHTKRMIIAAAFRKSVRSRVLGRSPVGAFPSAIAAANVGVHAPDSIQTRRATYRAHPNLRFYSASTASRTPASSSG
jgi:hypothetical protein